MYDVTVAFKNSSTTLEFEAENVELFTSTEPGTEGLLTGYSIVGGPPFIWLEVNSIAAVLLIPKEGDPE